MTTDESRANCPRSGARSGCAGSPLGASLGALALAPNLLGG